MGQNQATISLGEYETAVIYEAMIDRHARTPDGWALPMMSVRLLVKRTGLDGILQALEQNGVPWVAQRCRHEMTERRQFFADMIVRFPLEDLADTEEAVGGLANSLAVFDGLKASMRLLKFLDRLLRRHRTLKGGMASVYH